MLVTVRTILSLQGMVLNVTSTSLDELVLEKINLPVNFPQKAKGTLKKPRNFGFGLKRGGGLAQSEILILIWSVKTQC